MKKSYLKEGVRCRLDEAGLELVSLQRRLWQPSCLQKQKEQKKWKTSLFYFCVKNNLKKLSQQNIFC